MKATNENKRIVRMNKIVASNSAYDTWEELKARLDKGYTPSTKNEKFASLIEGEGYKIFWSGRKARYSNKQITMY